MTGARGSFAVPYLPVGADSGGEEIEAVARVLQSGRTLSCGPERDAFEEEFASYTGVRHAVTVTNCTVALELATDLLNLGAGDEVIATPQTYHATIQPLLARDIAVSFCDIDEDTLNVVPASFERLISERTRALYLVHYGGRCADMTAIMRIAGRHGIRVVEDCAHAMGATHAGRHAGSFDIGCFSFQSYKNISTLGEGGMLTLPDRASADTARRLRAIEPDADFTPRASLAIGPHEAPADGVLRHEKNAYTHDCERVRLGGTNSTLSEPACAVGRVQLRRVEALVARREQAATALDAYLADLPELRLQTPVRDDAHARHLYTLFLRPEAGLDRDAVASAIQAAGVEMHLRYFPIHLLPEWRLRGGRLGLCPVAERIWFEEQLNLPCYPQLEPEDCRRIANAVIAAIRSPGTASSRTSRSSAAGTA